jgi:hypothetical protein
MEDQVIRKRWWRRRSIVIGREISRREKIARRG